MQSEVSSTVLLPTQRTLRGAPDQGWTIETEIKTSLIPGAGNGRFAVEKVKKGTRVIVKPFVPMAKLTSLASIAASRTITFDNTGDLEKYIKLCAEEGGIKRDEVLDLFQNFVYALDGKRPCLNNSTWTMNHGETVEDGHTVRIAIERLDDGTEVGVGTATCDIAAGTELRNNYRTEFDMPVWYKAYCKEQKIKDVRTLVLEAVDGPSTHILPTQRAFHGAPEQGWTIDSEIKTSLIPGAGNGRFASEKVKKGTRVVAKPFIPMAKVTSLATVPANRTITFDTRDDLEKYIRLCAEEGDISREEVLDLFQNFVYALDGKRPCLNNSTWTMNHGETVEDGHTVRIAIERLDDGTEVGVGTATCDIAPGTELRNNYRKEFDMPWWYKAYCKEQKIKDVRTLVLEAVDGTSMRSSL